MAERLSPRLNWIWGIRQGNWEDSGGMDKGKGKGEWVTERQ